MWQIHASSCEVKDIKQGAEDFNKMISEAQKNAEAEGKFYQVGNYTVDYPENSKGVAVFQQTYHIYDSKEAFEQIMVDRQVHQSVLKNRVADQTKAALRRENSGKIHTPN